MLNLAWCLYARVCEFNDGSFKVDDRLIPGLEKKSRSTNGSRSRQA